MAEGFSGPQLPPFFFFLFEQRLASAHEKIVALLVHDKFFFPSTLGCRFGSISPFSVFFNPFAAARTLCDVEGVFFTFCETLCSWRIPHLLLPELPL